MIKIFKLPILYIWLVRLAFYIKGKQKDIELIDNDRTNTLYTSKRSKMRYIYISNWIADIANKLIKDYLYKQTSIRFDNKINEVCLPINLYCENDCIELHRDRDMFTSKPIKYVAVITVKQKGKEGLFTLHEHVSASNMGKNITVLSAAYKSISTKPGQVIVFDNSYTAHDFYCFPDFRMSLTYRTI